MTIVGDMGSTNGSSTKTAGFPMIFASSFVDAWELEDAKNHGPTAHRLVPFGPPWEATIQLPGNLTVLPF